MSGLLSVLRAVTLVVVAANLLLMWGAFVVLLNGDTSGARARGAAVILICAASVWCFMDNLERSAGEVEA